MGTISTIYPKRSINTFLPCVKYIYNFTLSETYMQQHLYNFTLTGGFTQFYPKQSIYPILP